MFSPPSDKIGHLPNIDLLKGILIILVIVGHLVLGSVHSNPIRYIIYSFHMPLFIAIAGFLFKPHKTNKLTLLETIKKYFFRLILPWILAVACYFMVTNKSTGDLSNLVLIRKALIHPYYHLWFVPGYISWISITLLLIKLKINLRIIVIIAFIISLSFIVLKKFPDLYSQSPRVWGIIRTLLHTLRPHFYFFFALGLLYRTVKSNLPNSERNRYIVLFLSVIGLVLLYFYPIKLAATVLFFVLNYSIISVLISMAQNNRLPSVPIIEWMGKQSLGLYLWHVIPIIIAKQAIQGQAQIPYYLVAIMLLLIFIAIYYQASRIRIINKYVLGIT